MHQPYTAPTLNSTRPATGIHRYTRQSSHHKPIHQRPQTHAHTRTPQIPHPYSPTNAQQPHPYTHTNQSTNDIVHTHRYHTPQIPQPYSLHTHTASTKPHTLDAAQAPVDVDVDVDADTQTLLQHRCSRSPGCRRSPCPVRNWTGQADRIRPYKTRPDRIRPPIHN